MQAEEIIKSPQDDRQYKSVILSNKLHALLIQDNDCEISGAALTVHCGNLNDPDNKAGLAHFLEHMLFLGNTSFPKSGEYQEFIQQHSGQTNAFTDQHETNFYFTVANEHLEEALHRFSQFFVSPTFPKDYADKELNAVESEFQKNVLEDNWRKHNLLLNQSTEGHIFKKFSIGNMQTLQGEDTYEALKQFHKEFYSSDIMKLVVFGSEPITQMELYVEKHFSSIPNNDYCAKREQWAKAQTMPFLPEVNLGRIIRAQPVKNRNSIQLNWVIKGATHALNYENPPGSYFAHVIGHEHDKSLLSILKQQDLAYELSSQSSDQLSHLFTLFQLNIDLTDKGLQHYEEVITIVYQYINLMKSKQNQNETSPFGVQEWIFQEQKQMKKLNFDFHEKHRPYQILDNYASLMLECPIKYINIYYYLYEHFRPDLLCLYLDQLIPANMMIFLYSQNFDQKDLPHLVPHFKIPYSFQNLEPGFMEHLSKVQSLPNVMDLPPRNVFFPKSLNLINEKDPSEKEHASPPTLIYQSQLSDLWFKPDTQFMKPKGHIYLKIFTNDLHWIDNNEGFICVNIWNFLFSDFCRELRYMGEMACLDISQSMAANGVVYRLSGYNDSMQILLQQIMQKLAQFDCASQRANYAKAHAKFVKEYENFYLNQPYIIGLTYGGLLLTNNSCFPVEQSIETLKGLSFERVSHLLNKHWLSKIRMQLYMSGNFKAEQAIAMVKIAEEAFLKNAQLKHTSQQQLNNDNKDESHLILSKDEVGIVRAVSLRQNEVCYYEEVNHHDDQSNSQVCIYFQCECVPCPNYIMNDKDDLSEAQKSQKKMFYAQQALLMIFDELVNPLFYKILRTEQQLGYVVRSAEEDIRGIFHYLFQIQSSVQPSHYLARQTEKFIFETLSSFFDNIGTQENRDQVSTCKKSVLVRVTEKDDKLSQQFNRFMTEISKNQYQFNRQSDLAEAVQLITEQDIADFYHVMFVKQRKQLEVHITAPCHVEQNEAILNERCLNSAKTNTPLHKISSILWFKRRMMLYPDFYSML